MARRNNKNRSQAGRLRIVAGKWRSRLLQIADAEGLRPTSERVRETLVNWLAPIVPGSRCLDVFAGTGALGLEALSRGADQVVFVERQPAAARELRKNIAALGADDAEVIESDALDYLRSPLPEPFDIVFLDPPFAADLLGETCRLLSESRWLAADALVYVELDRSAAEPELPPGWTVQKNRTAGNVRYMLVATGA
jgi:16S rRNA (guanine966-N2)-methyltransferase